MGTVKVTGGAALDAKLAQILDDAQLTMRAGILEGSRYPDGTPTALVAFWDEYGTSRHINGNVVTTPPRPFMRTTAIARASRWAKIVGVTMQGNGGDIDGALRMAGEAAVADIKQTIATFTDPPNAESTIAKKGQSQPLRDTKNMLNSVAFDIVDGEPQE